MTARSGCLAMTFAGLFLATAAVSATDNGAGTHEAGAWKAEVQIDRLTDVRIGEISAAATTMEHTDAEPPRLHVHCKLGEPPRIALSGIRSSDMLSHSVLYRFDREPADSQLWEARADALMVPRHLAADFLDNMMRHQTLIVRPPAFTGTGDVDFSLDGFATLFEEVCPSAAETVPVSREPHIEWADPQPSAARTQQERRPISALAAIHRAVSEVWSRPQGTPINLWADVRVRLLTTGEVEEVEITRGSGDPVFDQSVRDALHRASPLPVPDDDAFRRGGSAELSFRFNPD